MKCVNGHDIEVLRSAVGYYIGTEIEDEDWGDVLLPNCRISRDYWKTKEEAQEALDTLSFASRFSAMEVQYCNKGSITCFASI